MKKYIYIAIWALATSLALYVYWLHKERQRLLGFETAYKIQSKALDNSTKYSNVITSTTAALERRTMSDILAENKATREELKALNIRLNKVDSYAHFSIKNGEKISGIASTIDSLKVFTKRNEFGFKEIIFNPKTDSIFVTDTSFSDFSIIFHHHRKKYLGIGLGRKIFETTIKSSNPNIIIGKVESFQTK